ncbi:dual specificity protein kinase yak1 [Chytriomyces hyalinus]|nr:dual specificity protein kinase yak1 [Chytriomyces hyalinus]
MPPRSHQNPAVCLTHGLVECYARCNPDFNYVRDLNPKRVLTKPSKPALNDGFDNVENDYILNVNDLLGSQEGQQLSAILRDCCERKGQLFVTQGANAILDLLGQGTFGQVAKCVNMKTRENVAVKVIKNKPAYYNQSLVEVAILDLLNNKWDHADKYHIVHMKDTFVFRNHLCIVFEMLSLNLYELLKQNQFRGLNTALVRVFVKQILECLVLLSKVKIIHSDLKPENVLLKSLDAPNIKVIDFGSACHENHTTYNYIQSRFYRSPEVLVGLPYTSSIDMWSLGCIAAELFLGLPLFPGTSEYNQMSRIVGVMGMPENWMCDKGRNSKNFFAEGSNGWELKSMQSYMQDSGQTEQPSKQYFQGTTLEEIISSYPLPNRDMSPLEEAKERRSRLSLLDFLGGLLKLNPLERWSPQQAKMHPFVTGEEYTGPYTPASVLSLQRPVMAATMNTNVSQDSFAMDTESAETFASPATETTLQQHHHPQHQQQPVAASSASRRPRANTMIQAIPPQLQKIVTIQQQSGPNKVSLRNAAATGSGNQGDTTAFAYLDGHTHSNTTMNNGEAVYQKADNRMLPATSGYMDQGYPMGYNQYDGVSSVMQGSTSMAAASYDPKFLTNNCPLRKAVSETMYTTHTHFQQQQQQQQNQNNPAAGLPQMPMPSKNHSPVESLGNMSSGPTMHGINGNGIYYDGSHIPYDVLASMNHGYNPALDPNSNQQHPRLGEKGERKLGFASRAPSLPGLSEWNPFGNDGTSTHMQQQQQQYHESFGSGSFTASNERRSSASSTLEYSPNIEPNGGGPRDNARFENASSGSPRVQHRGSVGSGSHVLPMPNGYASSPRSAFPASPRNAYQPVPQSPHQYYAPPHPYQQQPVQQQQHHLMQLKFQNGYDGNASSAESSSHGSRGRSVSLSLHGQYPLNQPWNQPIQNHQSAHHTNGAINGGSNQVPGYKNRGAPPNISTAQASSPQHFQQGHQQPFSGAGSVGAFSAYSSAGPALTYSSHSVYSSSISGPISASSVDVSQIHPQRINHPANIGMRRSSIQYGSSPSAFASSSYHGSIPSGLSSNGRLGSSGSMAPPGMYATGTGEGGIAFSTNYNPGLGLDFTKSNIPLTSPKSASALSGRATRFSNLPPSLSDVPLIGEFGGVGKVGTVVAENTAVNMHMKDAIMSDVVDQQSG